MSGVKSIILVAVCVSSVAFARDLPACVQRGSAECDSECNDRFVQYKILKNTRGDWRLDQNETCSFCLSTCCIRDLQGGVETSNCMKTTKELFGIRGSKNVWIAESENSLTYTVRIDKTAANKRKLHLPLPSTEKCYVVIRNHRYEGQLCSYNRNKRSSLQQERCPEGYVATELGCSQKILVSRKNRGVSQGNLCPEGWVRVTGRCEQTTSRLKRGNARSRECSPDSVKTNSGCSRTLSYVRRDTVRDQGDYSKGAVRVIRPKRQTEGFDSPSNVVTLKNAHRNRRNVITGKNCSIGQTYHPVLGCVARQEPSRPTRDLSESFPRKRL